MLKLKAVVITLVSNSADRIKIQNSIEHPRKVGYRIKQIANVWKNMIWFQ